MIKQCPYCDKELNLSEGQQQKVNAALANLKTGTLKLGCPHCRKPINLRADGSLSNGSGEGGHKGPAQPAYPDISWLAGGMYSESTNVEDIPKVLVIMPDGDGRQMVAKVFEDIGYQIDYAESSADGIEKMRFVNFAAVVLHTAINGTLAKSAFHDHMKALPMDKRRYIYYTLVGPDFHTLYDLEALSYSANLVINDNEVPHFDIILRKGLRDYDDLFGPYINAINDHGAK